MKRAFFFDMDGVLFDSMPNHARAWDTVMHQHGFHFTREDTYLQEGRTGHSVIDEAFITYYGRHAEPEEWQAIYDEKTRLFHSLGEATAIPGVHRVLDFLRAQHALIYIVTGSGQQSLFDRLEHEFPSIFERERMITALDVVHGKPDPEPYLRAYDRACSLYAALHSSQPDYRPLSKADCVVIENAPLGVRAGHAAGLDVYAVNTGPLSNDCLASEGASRVFASMADLLAFLQS